MKNTQNTKPTTAIAKKVNFHSASYDDMSEMDEKELNAQADKDANRAAKKMQLVAKINQKQSEITKLTKNLVKSYLDPTQDTVDIKLNIRLCQEELQVAKEIFLQLFPGDKNLLG